MTPWPSEERASQALRENNLSAGGGGITRSGEMLLVQGLGRVADVQQIRDIELGSHEGVPVHIGDVASV